jgi:hypothetical protein
MAWGENMTGRNMHPFVLPFGEKCEHNSEVEPTNEESRSPTVGNAITKSSLEGAQDIREFWAENGMLNLCNRAKYVVSGNIAMPAS